MRRQATSSTRPELDLRRELHARGLRYRIQKRPLPALNRTADIVFGPTRVAVDVRGCFWHSCPDHGNTPENNQDWWTAKLERTTQRDAETERAWRDAGWKVVVVWEHEEKGSAADRVEQTVAGRRGKA